MTEFAGSLRERVALEDWAGTPEGGEWLPGGDAWGALLPADHGPAVLGEGRVARPRYRLTLRVRDVSLTTRVRWRGRVLSVLRVEPDPRARDRTTLLVEDRG